MVKDKGEMYCHYGFSMYLTEIANYNAFVSYIEDRSHP